MTQFIKNTFENILARFQNRPTSHTSIEAQIVASQIKRVYVSESLAKEIQKQTPANRQEVLSAMSRFYSC